MAFNIMDLFGPSAVNRMLQPLQSAAGIGGFQPPQTNRLLDPSLMAGGTQEVTPQGRDPWAGMREADMAVPANPQSARLAGLDAQQTGSTAIVPDKPGGWDKYTKDMFRENLNQFFIGMASGRTPAESLSFGALAANAKHNDMKNANQTVAWLQSKGLDKETAWNVAQNPQTLQKYLMEMVSPDKAKPLEINGKLVDPNTYQVIADFSTPKDGKDDRTALMKELEAAGLRPGTPQYQEAILSNNKPKGMMIESDGQGGFRMVQGADVSGGANLNVEQGKNTGFLIRAEDANKTITDLEEEGTSGLNRLAESVPLIGNYLVGEESQRLRQAKRDFINAVLRQESGAVISPEEFANADQQYFPQPGDRPEVIEQKRRNRENAVKGFRIRSGPGAQAVDEMQGTQPDSGVVDYRQYFGGQ